MITVSAVAKLIPKPPDLVDRRKQNCSAPAAKIKRFSSFKYVYFEIFKSMNIIFSKPYAKSADNQKCFCKSLYPQLYTCPYKMPKMKRGITLDKIYWIFLKSYSSDLLFSPNKLNKVQGFSSNSYRYLLTRKEG